MNSEKLRGKKLSEKEILEFQNDFTQKIMVWWSDKLLKKYSVLRRKLLIADSDQNASQESIFLIEEIIASLKRSISIASSAGIESKRIMVDPGIGFGKTTEHNLQIINRLKELTSLDLPILLGVSRKSFIGNVLEQPVDKRIWGTQAAVAVSIFNGVHVVRVHDVKEISQTIKMVDAIMNS